ncbi:MAG: response regulator [Candidatus Eisenbacteria bacterium]
MNRPREVAGSGYRRKDRAVEKPALERILVVDDEEMIRRVISLHLNKGGFEVLLAKNGREGIELAKSWRPDLILLDVMMPEMDGCDAARRLRSDFATSQIPIIMLTARQEVDDKLSGLEAGANDYITKPFAVTELIARIRTVLNWSKRQRSANPLTGLPGNVSIEEALDRRIEMDVPFAVVYVDLDHFKAYNDYYGYNEGDEAIKELARILVAACEEEGNGSEFIGHIGGDDFLILASPETAEPVARRVIAQFTASLSRLVRPEDLARGFLEVEGRTGEVTRHPILSVTLAMVTNEGRRIDHVAQVGDLASEVKRYGKAIDGSVLVRDRRRGESSATPLVVEGADGEIRGGEIENP